MRVKPEKPFIVPSRPGFLRAGAHSPATCPAEAKISLFRPEHECSKRILKPDYPLFFLPVCWLFPCQLEAWQFKLRSWCDCRCCAQLPRSTSSKFSELHCRNCSRSAWHVFQDLWDDSHKSGMFPFFYSFRGVVFRKIKYNFLEFLRGRAESR